MKSIFKSRASGSGSIMTNPQGKSIIEKISDLHESIKSAELRISEAKNKEAKTFVELRDVKIPAYKKEIKHLKPLLHLPHLSSTTKTFVYDWLKEHIYGVKKIIKTKYTDKGISYENTAIDKAIEWLDLQFVLKNESFFEDDYFTGTPDLITEDRIYDIKCSWDCFTFPLFETEIPTDDYFYQLQVYMHLTGKKNATLVYVLLNTPEEMHWEPQHNYDALDKKYRIKTFDIVYDASVIEDLQNRVIKIREFIQTLKY
jgi:hypothetical protein